MKKVFNLLVVVILAVFIVACGRFELKKNPHVKRVEYSKVDLDKAISFIRVTKLTTIDTSGDTVVSEFTGFEDNILISVLETEYKGLTFRNLIVGISEQLGEKCVVDIMSSPIMGGASITFAWGGGSVVLSIPLEIRKDGYAILEVPSFVAGSMERIWDSKDIPKEEKEEMIAREYKNSWEPSMAVFGEMVDMENPKYLDIIDKIKSRGEYLSVEKDEYDYSNFDKFVMSDSVSAEFLEEIIVHNSEIPLPYKHEEEYMYTIMDKMFNRLNANVAEVNAAVGNKIGAFLSVTYYSGRKELATLYFMLDEDLSVTEDISLEFKNNKVIRCLDVIHYANGI